MGDGRGFAPLPILWSFLMVYVGFFLRTLLSFSGSTNQTTATSIDTSNGGSSGTPTPASVPSKVQKTSTKFKDNNVKHWCVVAPKFLPENTRDHIKHFPHASEIILPCWSYFIEHETTDNCGFYFATFWLAEISPYSTELIETMGCTIQFGKDGVSNDGLVSILPKGDVQYVPNLYLLRPRFNYIRYIKEAEHAHALRRLFISDSDISAVKGQGKPLQIGMIQRTKSRRIENFDDIRDALQKAIPEANLVTTTFEYSTVKEQAVWFATKDVIIAAHGAAVANSVFITKDTIVMQLYPPNYFLESLEPLIEQSGGHAIQWYEKGKNPLVTSTTIEREEFDKAGQGMAPFSPPVDEVVKPVLYSLGRDQPTNKKLQKLYGEFV